MAETESTVIMEELRAIRKDISYIKEHMEDLFLTSEEEEALAQAMSEHKQGHAISLENFKKQMGD